MRVGFVSVGTVIERPEELAEMLKGRSVNNPRNYIQRRVSELLVKSARQKLFWIENDKNLGGGISMFLVEKFINKVIYISRLSAKMIVGSRYYCFSPISLFFFCGLDDRVIFMIVLSLLLASTRKMKLLSQQKVSIDVLQVVKKTIRTSMKILVMELGLRNGSTLWSLVQL